MGALPCFQLPNRPPHPPPTCPPPTESICDITGAEKTSSIQVACRNGYKILAI